MPRMYRGEDNQLVAFPMGGIGAGTICLEGTGALSHVSLYHRPDLLHEPNAFAALTSAAAGHGRSYCRARFPERKIFRAPGGRPTVCMGATSAFPGSGRPPSPPGSPLGPSRCGTTRCP